MPRKFENTIPAHLRHYLVEQDYDKYTARDHALWRFIVRNAKDFMVENAHSSFLTGLEMTGIPTDRIPRISEMDEKLSKFGWRAVCVCGFIPPLAFLEFQSSNILPIAADMRSVEHFDYTPAPDIVHEALGHAPILADPGYRNYLSKYAMVARRAVFSQEDVRLYEAIRYLSDIKENPDSSPEKIKQAERDLIHAQESIEWISEASMIARMYWWTVEYGLVGDIKHPKIYGSGLLSSLAEGRDCLNAKVEKIPLSKVCTSTSYDITEPQPQLFVAKNFDQLNEVLKEFESTLVYIKGGVEGLALAKKAGSVTTTKLNSGIEISGVLKEYVIEKGQLTFVQWTGPVQLCCDGKQLEDQGPQRHPEGFSSPLGMWKGFKKAPVDLSDKDLNDGGLKKNSHCDLEFISGFKVSGLLKNWERSADGKLLFLTWADCTVSKASKVYFEPSWGHYDLAIGGSVSSVYGGPADWEKYGEGNFGRSSTKPGRVTPYSSQEKHLFSLYSQARTLREHILEGKKTSEDVRTLKNLCAELMKDYAKEWLLAVELVELFYLLNMEKKETETLRSVKMKVLDLSQYPKTQSRFIKMGMELAESGN